MNDLFLKEHQDDTNERGVGRSQEECGGSGPGTAQLRGEKWQKEQHEEQEGYVVQHRDGAEQRDSEWKCRAKALREDACF